MPQHGISQQLEGAHPATRSDFTHQLCNIRTLAYVPKTAILPEAKRSKAGISRPISALGMRFSSLTMIQPMPKWSPLTGHLELLPPILQRLPKDAAQEYPFVDLARNFSESDNMYCVDLWPFFEPLMVISSPQMAIQVCQEYNLPKPGSLKAFFAPIAGGAGMFVANGAEWKRHRALFNPGFSANATMEHTKLVVREAEVFADIIRAHANKGDMFFLDELTNSYMMDVIGAVSL